MTASISLKNASLSFKKMNKTDFSIRRFMIDGVRGKLSKSSQSLQTQADSTRILKDISLELTEGSKLGLIGRNGAGKSTLLRMLAGIYEPTKGTISIKGRVTTLLNLGFYIDGNLTGMENIRLGCSLLHISKAERESIIEEIIDFSELGDYIYEPVNHYSDGMRARLGFSIITAVDPEILIIDEVIGTGDKFFINKALARINRLIESSSLLVMASHDENIIRKICNKVALIENGEIVALGDVEDVLEKYSVAA